MEPKSRALKINLKNQGRYLSLQVVIKKSSLRPTYNTSILENTLISHVQGDHNSI